MYLTLKQQVKHLSKKEFRNLKYLCHIAKNLKNQAIYNVRQHYFNNKKYLSYSENYKILKNSENYKKLNSNMKVLNYGLKKEFLDRYNIGKVLTENRLKADLIVEDLLKF